MTIRGRKPKPTGKKKLEGNPGHRPLNPNEPEVEPSLPTCPEHLNEEAKKEWQRVAQELFTAGLLGEIDRAALAAYCEAYGRWVEVERQLDKEGYIASTSKGTEIQHPYVGMANKLRHQVVQFAAEFGMTPSARSRVHAEPHTPEAGLEEKLFGKGVKVSK